MSEVAMESLTMYLVKMYEVSTVKAFTLFFFFLLTNLFISTKLVKKSHTAEFWGKENTRLLSPLKDPRH